MSGYLPQIKDFKGHLIHVKLAQVLTLAQNVYSDFDLRVHRVDVRILLMRGFL